MSWWEAGKDLISNLMKSVNAVSVHCVLPCLWICLGHTLTPSQRQSKPPLSFLPPLLAAVPFCITGAGNQCFVTAVYRPRFPSLNPCPPGYRPSYSGAIHPHLRSLCVYVFDWVCRWLEGVVCLFFVSVSKLRLFLCAHVFLFFVCVLSCLSRYLSHKFCVEAYHCKWDCVSLCCMCGLCVSVCVRVRECSPRAVQCRRGSGRPVWST